MHLIIILSWATLAWALGCLGEFDHKISPIDQALAHHCKESNCASHPFDTFLAKLATRLEGSGFHRTLHYSVELACPAAPPATSCELAILQPLPAAIYANIYELDGSAAAGTGPRVRLLGAVDVESIEEFSQPTALAIYHSFPEKAAAGAGCGAVNASVLLHGRYPKPTVPKNKDKIWWKDLLNQDQVEIVLPPPELLLRCSPAAAAGDVVEGNLDGFEWKKVAVVQENRKNGVKWLLPAGNLRLTRFTAAVTAFFSTHFSL